MNVILPRLMESMNNIGHDSIALTLRCVKISIRMELSGKLAGTE